MKIPKYLLGVITIVVALFFMGNTEVKAEKYSGQAIWPSEHIDNVFITKERPDGYVKWQQARFIRRSEDNKFVYCLQPFVDIDNTNIYNVARSDYAAVLNMSEEQWQRVALLAYYGYGYGSHSTHKWYAVTQILIWRTVEPTSQIYFTNSLNGTRNDSIYANEIAELEALVQQHSKKPNIKLDSSTLNLGQSYTFTDENGVLDNYTVSNSNNLRVTKNGNQITITPTAIGNGSISFEKTHNVYDSDPIVYYATGTQDVMRVGNVDPIRLKLDFNVIGGKLTLQKLDRDTGNNIGQGDGELGGAIYGIYDMAGNLITKIVTDKNGKVQSDFLPYLGQYKLREISSSKGYELDLNEYLFEITEQVLEPNVTVYEQVIKRPIKIHKYYANGQTGSLIPEGNVRFEFYNKNNEKVASVDTDENGYATLNLPYGTYTGKQVTTTSGHEKVEDFTVVINEHSPEVINLSFSNAPITAKLKLVKIDYDSKLVIPYKDVTFKIKNIDTGEYVCQTISYPEKQEVCEFKTDENGEFMTAYPLVAGSYQIEELTSPKGYLLSDDKLVFRIDEKSEIISDSNYGKYIAVQFANKKIMGEILIEKLGEKLKIDNGTFDYEIISLEGIEFSIYAAEDITTLDGIIHYKKGDLVKTITTKTNGTATFTELYLGKYIVKETKTLDEYVLDETEYEVELTEIDNKTAIVSKTLEITNKLKKGELEFTKTDLVNGEPIADTIIQIFTSNNELIFEGKTDNEGKVVIKELSVGKYYIIEKEAATGYVITDEKVEFEILEDGEVVKAKMSNKPITGTLEFTKIDFSTSEALPNTLIQIYKELENDADPELVFEGKTDEFGNIIIEELRYGKYYIIEKEAPEGYILNEEKMAFEILEDGEIVKCTMVNELAPIDVPNTGIEDSYVIEIVGGLLFLVGIGGFAYAIKKKRK